MILKNRLNLRIGNWELGMTNYELKITNLYLQMVNFVKGFLCVFNKQRKHISYFIFHISYFITLLFLSSSCGKFSFTGTTLSNELKTVTVNNFVMATAGGPASMPLTFTEKLKEYYQRNTSLKLKPNDGDLLLEGSIVGYELTPVSVTSGDKAAMNRLTITVEVRFVNKLKEEENFEKDFSFYQDFAQEQALSQVESSLVPKILDQIVLNIFTETAAKW